MAGGELFADDVAGGLGVKGSLSSHRKPRQRPFIGHMKTKDNICFGHMNGVVFLPHGHKADISVMRMEMFEEQFKKVLKG